MNRRTITYGIILLALIVLAVFVFVQDDDSSSSSSTDKAAFKTENIEDVSKIYLEDRAGENMLLTKVDGEWMLNDTFPARKQYVDMLLEALGGMEIKAPVASTAVDRVVNEMMKISVKAEIYTNDDEPDRIIHIGGPTNDNEASYMMLQLDEETTSLPYEMFLPGYRGYLSPRFAIDAAEWRSRELFAFSLEEINTVSVVYDMDTAASFSMENKNSKFSITSNDIIYTEEEVAQEQAVTYLLQFELIGVDGYELQAPDTVVQMGLSQRFARLSIEDQNNDIHALD
ncbi:MAG: hypothetical protein ACPG4Z_06585, partial [Chitinophagales bacterium]